MMMAAIQPTCASSMDLSPQGHLCARDGLSNEYPSVTSKVRAPWDRRTTKACGKSKVLPPRVIKKGGVLKIKNPKAPATTQAIGGTS
jgi:hypothetical protein